MSSKSSKQPGRKSSTQLWWEGLVCDEYWPVGRYLIEDEEYDELDEPVDLGESEDPSGVPDEVLGPDHEWMPLELFVECVAVNWTRTLLRPDADGERVVSFSRVLRHRIERHRQYADTAQCFLGLQNHALQTPEGTPRCVHLLEALGIAIPREEEYEELKAWQESSIVQIPWAEYRHHYTDLDTHTTNPLWPRVQWYLSNTNRSRGYCDWERLGFGDWMRPIDKRDWTHEDHACRFILRLYDLVTDSDSSRERTPYADFLTADRRIGRRIAESYDERDKAWFGYSLLCLLIRSWQYKRTHPERVWADDEQLIPALYLDYEPNPNAKYPPIQVGVVNLSPFTPWIYKNKLPKNLDHRGSDLGDDEDFRLDAEHPPKE